MSIPVGNCPIADMNGSQTNRQMTHAVDVVLENERHQASYSGNLPMLEYGLKGTLNQRFGTLLPMKLAKIAMNPYHGKIYACK